MEYGVRRCHAECADCVLGYVTSSRRHRTCWLHLEECLKRNLYPYPHMSNAPSARLLTPWGRDFVCTRHSTILYVSLLDLLPAKQSSSPASQRQHQMQSIPSFELVVRCRLLVCPAHENVYQSNISSQLWMRRDRTFVCHRKSGAAGQAGCPLSLPRAP